MQSGVDPGTGWDRTLLALPIETEVGHSCLIGRPVDEALPFESFSGPCLCGSAVRGMLTPGGTSMHLSISLWFCCPFHNVPIELPF
jgi:hypothetical protein